MSDRPNDSPAGFLVYLLVGLGGVIYALSFLFWLAGQFSGVVTGRGWPDSEPVDVLSIARAAVENPGDPGAAWTAVSATTVGPGWLIYLFFATLVVPSLVATGFVTRFVLSMKGRKSPAAAPAGQRSTGAEPWRAMSAQVVERKARVVRPSLARRRRVDALDAGFLLGRETESGQPLYLSVEDVLLVIAPPRQGKDTHLCIPFTIDAPGPCVVTSARLDAFAATFTARARVGEIHVFDPDGMTNWPRQVRWSPVRGCTDPMVAANRAGAFVTSRAGDLGTEGRHWMGSAITILRCYLHAAALEGRTIRDVVRWSRNPVDPEPVEILRAAEAEGAAAPGWAGELKRLTSAKPSVRTAMWATLGTVLSAFGNQRALDACTPAADSEFDLAGFLSGRNTLYVLGMDKQAGSVAPIVTAMLEDLLDRARRMALRMPDSRLDPPLTVQLNDAVSVAPLPNLPAYLGDSGGHSIALHVYLRSLAQAKAVWGDAESTIMWDNAAVRVLSGGGGNAADAEDMSRLVGRSLNPLMLAVDADPDATPVLSRSAEDIRGLPFGTALVIARGVAPMEVELTPWWKRRDRKALASGKAATEKLIEGYGRDSDRREQEAPSSRRFKLGKPPREPAAGGPPQVPLASTLVPRPAGPPPVVPPVEPVEPPAGPVLPVMPVMPVAPVPPPAGGTPVPRFRPPVDALSGWTDATGELPIVRPAEEPEPR